jgi:hypothetical protein
VDRKEFDAFLAQWCAENIRPMGERVDPSDREYVAKRKAQRLEEFARENACRAMLYEVTGPYGSVVDWVKAMYELAEHRTREGL